MSKKTETSYGARLYRGQSVVTYIASFTGYNPPRPEEYVENFRTFLNQIVTINESVKETTDNYSVAVNQRQMLFKKSETSMIKILPNINGQVQSMFGKKSPEYKKVSALISQIRSARLIKAPVDPEKPDAKDEISRSTRSYGSLTQYFADLLVILRGLQGYNPSNTAISTANLETLLNSLTEANDRVTAAFSAKKSVLTDRVKLYDDLKVRVERIKAYIKSQYGINSKEFQLVKGITV